MPMGATNAPKHFHQVMGIILSKLPFSHDIRYYQDDIFVAATDAKQLKQRYQRTIDYLMSQNFQINYDKSQLQCTDLLGYTLKNHTLSIPDQKWKRINELLHSNNLQLIQRAAQTLAYYKHTLNSNQQLTIQKLLTNKVKDSEILSIYSKALSSKPQMTFTTSAGEPLKLYLDTSNQAAGLVLKQANNTLLSASIPLPAVHNYANTNEAQGAYMLIKRYLSQIKDYVYTAKSELQVFSDNMLLAKALAGLSKITLGSETQYYARKIKILIATIKDTRTTYNYIQGKLNPADKPSRRTHKTQDTKWKATRQSNKHLAAKIFAHGTRSNFYHLFPKTNDKIKVDYKERNFQR
ncbi:RNA-directed DNA polymerase [Gregarina niphandrodes]|uniref:RNA-directed DNA polymerase n=1 Tax=Gregarina niphandrodes TaxID=110365 RepID=A0A023B251_GRENI|nr:RNA-directed DNA polymerase [Gregarina niphandrodes]EZG51317.1 RNA-directed DNA polymerase [Gregarina niphandrodes]|eukprot:XP_011131981.1 RNA-directed DNA polymerase [Gregarina niphandrodes]